MAWFDNRAWCHPKIVNLSDKAHRVWFASICYSSGFVTNGRLTKGQQTAIGSSPKIRRELEAARLWLDEGPDILIKDWDVHNGDRDRKAEERKRYMREYQARRRSGNSDVNVDVNVDVTPLTVEEVTSEVIDQDLGSNDPQVKSLEDLSNRLLRDVA